MRGAGEAQKIDRIMEKFAERFCLDNPGVFPTADAAYILSFALIMLNTDAHNPQADKKISQEDFVGMSQFQACPTAHAMMRICWAPMHKLAGHATDAPSQRNTLYCHVHAPDASIPFMHALACTAAVR